MLLFRLGDASDNCLLEFFPSRSVAGVKRLLSVKNQALDSWSHPRFVAGMKFNFPKREVCFN